MAKQKAYFYLRITDEKKHQSNLVGPMSDASAWNQAIEKCMKAGRDIRCSSVSCATDLGLYISKAEDQLKTKFIFKLLIKPPANWQ